MPSDLTLTAVFTPDEEVWTMAQLAEWPAVVTCGRTVDEARAAREMLASYRDEGREPPIGTGHVERLTSTPRLEAPRARAPSARLRLRADPRGANHAIWSNPTLDLRAPVPRHREIPTVTARAICRQLSVPGTTGSR